MLKDWLIRRSFWILLALGMVLEIAFYALSQITDLKTQLSDFFYYFTHAFVIYTLVLLYVKFFWGKSFLSVEMIVGFGILFRLTLLFGDPILSDDMYRYIWDGKVANAGINPYRYPPESDNIAGLRDRTIYPNINHKEINTIYPPMMQALFRAVTLLSDSVWAMKLMILLFDIGIMIVILALLKHFDRALSWVLVYAWNPLVVIELAGSGHSDAVGIFFLMLGLWFAVKYRAVASALMLALSFLSKYLAVIVLPFVEDIRSRFKIVLAAIAAFAAVAVAGFLPFRDAGDYLFSALDHYSATWEFNSFLYHYVYNFLKDVFANDPSPYLFGIFTDNKARLLAKMIGGFIWLCFFTGLFIAHLRKSYAAQKPHIIWAAYLLVATFTLVNPTLHPWYLIWVIPFLCFFPNPAWILLTGLVTLSYTVTAEYQKTGVWQESAEIRLWEYAPFYVLLILLAAWNFYQYRQAHPGGNE